MGYTCVEQAAQEIAMNRVMSITGIFAVLAIAIFGCLLIFDVVSLGTAGENLLRVIAAIALLAVCAALVGILVRSSK